MDTFTITSGLGRKKQMLQDVLHKIETFENIQVEKIEAEKKPYYRVTKTEGKKTIQYKVDDIGDLEDLYEYLLEQERATIDDVITKHKNAVIERLIIHDTSKLEGYYDTDILKGFMEYSLTSKNHFQDSLKSYQYNLRLLKKYNLSSIMGYINDPVTLINPEAGEIDHVHSEVSYVKTSNNRARGFTKKWFFGSVEGLLYGIEQQNKTNEQERGEKSYNALMKCDEVKIAQFMNNANNDLMYRILDDMAEPGNKRDSNQKLINSLHPTAWDILNSLHLHRQLKDYITLAPNAFIDFCHKNIDRNLTGMHVIPKFTEELEAYIEDMEISEK